MALANVATQFILKDLTPYDGIRLELAVDKMAMIVAVGLPLFLTSIVVAQEVSVGSQISCFPPASFSQEQAGSMTSFCWAAVQQQADSSPLWLHKLFPYILLLLAMVMFIPTLFWRFTAAPHLSSDLSFIMVKLDQFYDLAIKAAQSDQKDQTETFKYVLVKNYLKVKRLSKGLFIKYLAYRGLTLLILLLAIICFGRYIWVASLTKEFLYDLRTGVLNNSSMVTSVQCKLVTVEVYRLLSCINLAVYVTVAVLVGYTVVGPLRQSSSFLGPYTLLPGFGTLGDVTPKYNDLCIYLMFLHENLSALKSFKYLQVLQMLKNADNEGGESMPLLESLREMKGNTASQDQEGNTASQDQEGNTASVAVEG